MDFYACEEHIEDIIDDFINVYNISPNIIFTNETCKNYCNYCDYCAKYMLLGFNE